MANAVVGGVNAGTDHGIFFNPAETTATIAGGSSGQSLDSLTAQSVDITEGASSKVRITDLGSFANSIVGVYGFFDFEGAYAGDDGYHEVLVVDGSGNFIEIDVSYISDTTINLTCAIGGACPITGAGHTAGDFDLQDVFDSTIASAAAQNVEIYMTGNGTLSANLDKDAGGGSASTMWHWYGCDSSYARVVPTRTSISGGIANSLLVTAGMPTITCGSNVVNMGVAYVHIDGIAFTGTVNGGHLVGAAAIDFQQYSNCSIINAGTTGTALRTDDFGTVTNCDCLATDATTATTCLHMDTGSTIRNSILRNDSSSSSSINLDINNATVVGCLFYDFSGTGILFRAGNTTRGVANCTFDTGNICIAVGNVASNTTLIITDCIVANSTTFATNLYSGTTDLTILASYNTIEAATVTNDYLNFAGDTSIGELTSAPSFVSIANDDYNLQDDSPSKNTGSLLRDRGAMSSEESGGGGLLTHPGMSGGFRG